LKSFPTQDEPEGPAEESLVEPEEIDGSVRLRIDPGDQHNK
jgi:hypothetical protein